MRLQLKKHESKLKQLTEELCNRKHAVDNAKDKKHVRIESDLLQANRAAYTVNAWLPKLVVTTKARSPSAGILQKTFRGKNTGKTRYWRYFGEGFD
jgi:hypothetical protein